MSKGFEKSKIMQKAWAEFRRYAATTSDRAACFAACLRQAWRDAKNDTAVREMMANIVKPKLAALDSAMSSLGHGRTTRHFGNRYLGA